MQASPRRRAIWVILLTAAFAASLGAMFAFGGGFEPVWFSASLFGYIVLGLVALFAGRSPARALEGDAMGVREGAASVARAAPVAPANVLAHAPRDRPELDLPKRAEPPVPAGFTLKGFTLFERAAKAGGAPSRFFARRPPPGAQAIPLPPGYEAAWDRKQKKPVLRAPEPILTLPGPAVRAEPEAVEAKPCAAFVSVGELCESRARAGSRYCARHARYNPERDAPRLEVLQDRGRARKGRAVRPGAAGGFEVIVPRGALGEAPPRRLGGRRARPGKTAARRDAPSLEVRAATPTAARPLRLRLGEPVVVTAKPRAAKPLRLRLGDPQIVTERPRAGKPIRFRLGEPEVVTEKPRAGKPLRVGVAEPEVRLAKPKLRWNPLGRRESRVEIIGPKAHAARPLKSFDALGRDAVVVQPRGRLAEESARRGKAGRSGKPPQCAAHVASGRRCPKAARPGHATCATHRTWRPTTELVVVPDSRTRSSYGVGEQAAAKRGRARRAR